MEDTSVPLYKSYAVYFHYQPGINITFIIFDFSTKQFQGVLLL